MINDKHSATLDNETPAHIKALIESLEANANTSMKTAMTAMTNMGEMGVLLAFMSNSFSIGNTHELAVLIVDTLKRYELDSAVQISLLGDVTYVSSQEPISQEDKDILIKSRHIERMQEENQQFIVNYDDATLLVKNMPEDEETRGRYRDHLTSLMEAANARLQSFMVHQEISEVVKDASQSLTEIEKIHRQQKEITTKITDELSQQLAKTFDGMGLTEEQEDDILDFVHVSVECLLENLKSSNQADNMLVDIIKRLKHYS